MAKAPRIFNATRGYYVSYKHALRGIEQCAFAWLSQGESVRDLTLAEAITARNEQARLMEPLECAELPGVKFEPPKSGQAAHVEGGTLVWQAHEFARLNSAKGLTIN